MSKIALLGDTHFGASKHSEQVHVYMAKFYKFFFKYLESNSIDNVIQLGDLYDIRKYVHISTIKWVNEVFFNPIENNKINLFVIAGNHDVAYKNSNYINSVSVLCPDSVVVIDIKPETIKICDTYFDMYPWINVENLDASLKKSKDSSSRFAIGHFELKGFPMNPGTIAESGMSHTVFANYEQVFSGHFHTISQRDNIQFTGTPCELNFSDCSDPKGFWVLDTVTGVKEFIRNPYTLFEKISYIEDMKYDFTQVCEKYIKINIVEKKCQKKFDLFLDNINMNKPHDVKIIESSISASVNDAVKMTDLVSTDIMILTFIENLEIDLDKIKLKNHVVELYNEAVTINNTF